MTTEANDRDDDGSNGICGTILTVFSLFLIAITFPFSLCLVIKMVQVRVLVVHRLYVYHYTRHA